MLLCLTEVEWREVGEYWTEEEIWPRNRTCPQEGEIRWCQTHYSEGEEIRLLEKRWLLFQKGQSLVNRWIDSCEELDALTLVEAEILSIKKGTASPAFSGGQWLRVRCLQIIPFAQIPQRLPPMQPSWSTSPPSPVWEPEYASERLFLYENGGEQVTESYIYARDETPPGSTHFIFYKLSILNQCEIYNWSVK